MSTRDELFLETLADLESRCEPGRTEYDVLGIAGLLRKLLIDAQPLVDQVNRDRHLRLRFVINDRPIPEDPLPMIWSMQDGFDPETAHRAFPKEVKRDDLLTRPIVAVNGSAVSVRDVIRYGAHVKGAIHAGEPESDQERALVEVAAAMQVGGFDPGVRSLLAVTRVVLRGLQPLRQRILAEASNV